MEFEHNQTRGRRLRRMKRTWHSYLAILRRKLHHLANPVCCRACGPTFQWAKGVPDAYRL